MELAATKYDTKYKTLGLKVSSFSLFTANARSLRFGVCGVSLFGTHVSLWLWITGSHFSS